jgi:hypothetical protein
VIPRLSNEPRQDMRFDRLADRESSETIPTRRDPLREEGGQLSRPAYSRLDYSLALGFVIDFLVFKHALGPPMKDEDSHRKILKLLARIGVNLSFLSRWWG